MTWWTGDVPLLPNLVVEERDHRPAVVYDHTGQVWARPKPPLGFIDPDNLPSSKPSKR
jgi:hypothetical protein